MRLTAPPSASKAIPPAPPDAPPTRCSLSTPDNKVPIPWLLSGLVKKSDLAYSEARDSWPAGFWVGRWHSFTVRLAQPASTSIACSQDGLTSRNGEDGSEPAAAYSFSSSADAALLLPRQVPPTWIDGIDPPGAAARGRFDQSSSGACGAHDCQAEITRAAWDQGQDRKNRTISLAGWVENVNEVTTPKLPPPPPRQAQNRAGLLLALHVRSTPSAVTICKEVTLSLVRP